jgi:hypothetical protein
VRTPYIWSGAWSVTAIRSSLFGRESRSSTWIGSRRRIRSSLAKNLSSNTRSRVSRVARFAIDRDGNNGMMEDWNAGKVEKWNSGKME